MEENSIFAREKLLHARKLLVDQLPSEIYEIIIDKIRPILIVKFTKSIIVHIRYNNFDEYSYQINFSKKKFDRIRYDNYDDKWDVISNPHHMHPRNEKSVIKSPMVGNPEKDMLILVKVLKKLF